MLPNPSVQEAEEGDLYDVPGQPDLLSETMSTKVCYAAHDGLELVPSWASLPGKCPTCFHSL